LAALSGRLLAERGLTPVSTATVLGISLRQLHLLFEPTGTQLCAARRAAAAITVPSRPH